MSITIYSTSASLFNHMQFSPMIFTNLAGYSIVTLNIIQKAIFLKKWHPSYPQKFMKSVKSMWEILHTFQRKVQPQELFSLNLIEKQQRLTQKPSSNHLVQSLISSLYLLTATWILTILFNNNFFFIIRFSRVPCLFEWTIFRTSIKRSNWQII